MKSLLISALWLCISAVHAQPKPPVVSIRLSMLVVPFTPLLTVEYRTIGNLTVQGETNFINTHGVNVKYYLRSPLEGGYVFVGNAFVRSSFLREDHRTTWLPYAGWGYAHVWARNWVADGRLGIGPTLNADRNTLYPVLKIGVGKRF
jgi:hypothetical protein